MDPTANLREQRELADAIIYAIDQRPDNRDIEDNGIRLAELVVALDEWRASGGFDPYRN